jgi:hypothetical protein
VAWNQERQGIEDSMKKECVIDSLPAEHGQVFVEVLAAKDPYLLAALRSARTLT